MKDEFNDITPLSADRTWAGYWKAIHIVMNKFDFRYENGKKSIGTMKANWTE